MDELFKFVVTNISIYIIINIDSTYRTFVCIPLLNRSKGPRKKGSAFGMIFKYRIGIGTKYEFLPRASIHDYVL